MDCKNVTKGRCKDGSSSFLKKRSNLFLMLGGILFVIAIMGLSYQGISGAMGDVGESVEDAIYTSFIIYGLLGGGGFFVLIGIVGKLAG